MSKTFVAHRVGKTRGAPAPAPEPEAARAPSEQSSGGSQTAREAEKRTSTGAAKPEGVAKAAAEKRAREVGGPSGPEPTRYGDWEHKGICYDF